MMLTCLVKLTLPHDSPIVLLSIFILTNNDHVYVCRLLTTENNVCTTYSVIKKYFFKIGDEHILFLLSCVNTFTDMSISFEQ